MEQGAPNQHKGKSLSEIDIDLNEDLLESVSKEEEIEDVIEPIQEIDGTGNIIFDVKHTSTIIKKTDKRILTPWTTEQKEAVNFFFIDHIKKKQPPKKEECLKKI